MVVVSFEPGIVLGRESFERAAVRVGAAAWHVFWAAAIFWEGIAWFAPGLQRVNGARTIKAAMVVWVPIALRTAWVQRRGFL